MTNTSRLRTASVSGNLRGTYTYDHRALRTRKVAGTVTTLYHYDQTGTLILETDAAGAVGRTYVVADGNVIGQIERETTAPAEIIVDNLQATYTGTWPTSTSISGYYGTNYQRHSSGSSSTRATWTPTIPAAGSYQVYARWVQSSNNASNAIYRVTHASGTTNVTKSQRTSGGTWVSLGTFTFNAGSSGNIVLNASANGTLIADAVRFVATTAPPGAEVIRYVHTDHEGTPRLATNSTGAKVWSWEGEAFGNTPATGTATVNLRYAGQYFDGETGLYYNHHRYYWPQGGRYITSDPMSVREHVRKWKSAGMPGHIPLESNSYLYVAANPLRWIDPKGLEVKICCRPAEIAGGLIDHCWVQTDTMSGGMGADPNIPPGQQYEGYGMSTQVTDHSKDKSTYCIPQNNVDEQCVNSKLKPGTPTGPFIPPFNHCQSFAYGTVNACRTGPQISPQITPSK